MASHVAQDPCLSRHTSAVAYKLALTALQPSLSQTWVSLGGEGLGCSDSRLGLSSYLSRTVIQLLVISGRILGCPSRVVGCFSCVCPPTSHEGPSHKVGGSPAGVCGPLAGLKCASAFCCWGKSNYCRSGYRCDRGTACKAQTFFIGRTRLVSVRAWRLCKKETAFISTEWIQEASRDPAGGRASGLSRGPRLPPAGGAGRCIAGASRGHRIRRVT